jgi:hypothetical protein
MQLINLVLFLFFICYFDNLYLILQLMFNLFHNITINLEDDDTRISANQTAIDSPL